MSNVNTSLGIATGADIHREGVNVSWSFKIADGAPTLLLDTGWP